MALRSPCPDDEADGNLDRLRLILEIHAALIKSLEWSVENIGVDELNAQLPELIRRLLRAQSAERIRGADEEELIRAVLAEVTGLGPLEPLMADFQISDILVNGYKNVYIEKLGRLIPTSIRFADDAHLIRIIQRIVGRVGRRVDESSPSVDARLPDGSRVHAIIPPLAINGPTLSIRRFGASPLSTSNLVEMGALMQPMVQFLAAAVESRISFLISGGTGSGKTTLLNALSAFISQDERIVTIEDAAELQMQHNHVISLETRAANAEGNGEITTRDLVKASLRMRPDRILIGEVRGAEALDMLQALNTGHAGSLSTLHANDAQDALSRLEMMVEMSGCNLPMHVLRKYIASGLRLLVHVGRLKGGARRVLQIAEIVGIADGELQLKEIFGFRQMGVDAQGNAFGNFYSTGYVPQCLQQIEAAGLPIPRQIFREWEVAPNEPESEPLMVAEPSSSNARKFQVVISDAEPVEDQLDVLETAKPSARTSA